MEKMLTRLDSEVVMTRLDLTPNRYKMTRTRLDLENRLTRPALHIHVHVVIKS